MADFGYADYEEAKVGADGLEVVAGRNPVTEVLNGDRDVERVFIADGAEGSRISALWQKGQRKSQPPRNTVQATCPG